MRELKDVAKRAASTAAAATAAVMVETLHVHPKAGEDAPRIDNIPELRVKSQQRNKQPPRAQLNDLY